MARIQSTLLMFSLVTACAVDGGGAGDPGAGEQGDQGDPGGEGEDGRGGDGPQADGALPTYPTQHPRIYLTPNRARLQAALAAGTPAATRFRTNVNQWLGGASIWGFESWNGALLAQLTGNTTYCTKAVADGRGPGRRRRRRRSRRGSGRWCRVDSYLEVGELIGDLALVYDWCFAQVDAGAARALARVREPGGVERLEPGRRRGGARPMRRGAAGRSTTRRTTTTTRSCARRCCSASRRRARTRRPTRGSRKFRDEKVLGQLVPTFDGRSRRRRLARGHRLRRRDAPAVRAVRLLEGDDRRDARDEDRRTRARRCSRSCTRSCRRSTGSRRPAITRATRRRRSSTTTATTCRS